MRLLTALMVGQQIKELRDWSRRIHFFASAFRLEIRQSQDMGLLACQWSKPFPRSNHAQWTLQSRVLKGVLGLWQK